MRNFDISNDRLGVLYGISATEPEQNLAALPQRARTYDGENQTRISEKKRSHDVADGDHGDDDHDPTELKNNDLYRGQTKEGKHTTKKFRFKKKSSRRDETDEERRARHRSHRSTRDDGEGDEKRSSTKDHRHRSRDEDRHRSRDRDRDSKHRRRHSSKSRTKLSEKDYLEKGFTKPPTHPPDDPTEYDDTYLPNAQSYQFTDPDAAFRASLFDAMADDEGAAFWEGVYGQRVDIYPRPEVSGPQNEVEQLNDEEYAAYVREKMYEKTHEYIFEERERREKARQKAKEEKEKERQRWEEMERERVEREASRRRRKARDRMSKRWEEYVEAWARIVGGKREEEGEPRSMAIPWPVETGNMKDVSMETVKDFYFAAKSASDTAGLFDLLKLERIKWHPDKMQQRWGQLEEEILRGVNTTFQIIDDLWVEVRTKKEKVDKL